jgi:transposase InsO family protein
VHLGQNALKQLSKAIIGCEFSSIKPIDLYKVRIQAKQTNIISKTLLTLVKSYLEKVYTDICGSLNPNTFRGYKYIATFIDIATCYAEIALLKNKDDVFNEFQKFITLEENQTGFKLKRLHLDNGLEYRNELFDSFLIKKGVIATYAAPYAYKQNGLAEKFNRTLLDKVKALLI